MSRLPALVLPVTLLLAFSARPQRTPTAAQEPTATKTPGAADTMTPRQTEELHADILMAKKLFPDAIAIYEKLLEKESKNAVLLNKVGIAYQQEGRSDRAQHFYKRALKADRTYVSALNNLGTIEYEKHKYRKAVRLYKEGLQYQPKMATLYSNLGYAYFAEKKFDAAMEAFQKALALDPGALEHHGGFGTIVQSRTVEDYGRFYFLMAKTYALAGDVEHCAHFLKMARDEGYKDLASVRKDPAFSKVLSDPRIEEVLQGLTSVAVAPENPSRS